MALHILKLLSLAWFIFHSKQAPAQPLRQVNIVAIMDQQHSNWTKLDQNLNAHPFFERDEKSRIISGFYERPIFSIDENWRFTCNLCSEPPKITAKKINTEGTSNFILELKIANHAIWSDGLPLHEEDFRFSWIVAQSFLKNKSLKTDSRLAFFKQVENISTKEGQPNTILFEFSSLPSVENLLQVYILSKALHQPLWRKAKSEASTYLKSYEAARMKDEFKNSFISSLIEDHSARTKNSRCFDDSQQAAKVCLAVYSKTQYTKLQKGGLGNPHIIFDFSSLQSPLNEHELFKKGYQNFSKDFYFRPKLELLALNTRNPKLNNDKARHRLRAAIVENLARSTHNHNPFSLTPQNSPFYYPIPPVITSPPKGFKSSIELAYSRSSERRKKMAKLLSRVLKPLKARSLSKKYFFTYLIPEIRFTGMALVGLEMHYPYRWSMLLGSGNIPTKANHFRGKNIFSWVSSPTDKAINVQRNESILFKTKYSTSDMRYLKKKVFSKEDYVRINQLFASEDYLNSIFEVQKELEEDAPLIPLFHYGYNYLVSDKLTYFPLPGHQFAFSHFVHLWKNKPKIQISIKKEDTKKL